MNHSLDDILMPLAITVVIDQKVRDPERAAFLEQAHGLIELFELGPMNDTDIMAWFTMHEGELQEKLSGKRRNTAVLRSLSRFEQDLYVENIFEAMVAISISDLEYVSEESDLIKSAGALWGFRKPPIKVSKKED